MDIFLDEIQQKLHDYTQGGSVPLFRLRELVSETLCRPVLEREFDELLLVLGLEESPLYESGALRHVIASVRQDLLIEEERTTEDVVLRISDDGGGDNHECVVGRGVGLCAPMLSPSALSFPLN